MNDILLILKAIGVMGLYFVLFFLAGCLYSEKVHQNRLMNVLLTGFFTYFSAFHLMALPMKLLHVKLHILSISWMAAAAVMALFVLTVRRRVWIRVLAETFSRTRKEETGSTKGWTAFLLAFGIFITLLLGINYNHVSDYDAGYYIGLPMSSVYSDTIELMDPYSGQMLDEPNPYYRLNTFTIHSAVVWQITKLSLITEEKFTMTMTLCVLFILCLYKTGGQLFPGEGKKAVLFTWFSLLALMFSYSLSGVSHYFAYRAYEGKAITAYLLMTAVFCSFLSVYREKEAGFGWRCLFLCGLCGICFCNTAVLVVPVLTGALLVPLVLYRRSGKILLSLILVLLPSVFWILASFL